MKRIVRLTESELNKLVKKIIKEGKSEMRHASHRRDFEPTPREEDIIGVFGDFYGEDVPPVVIRYMRKNPDAILRRLSKIYPDIYMRHAPVQPDYRDYDEPIGWGDDDEEDERRYDDRVNYGDDDESRYDDRDYRYGNNPDDLDEAKQVTSTQYDLRNAQDVADFNRDKDDVTDVDKIKVGQNMAQIDSSYDPTLDESDDNPFEDIPMWKGKK